MVQVQLRVPDEMVKQIDIEIKQRIFQSRSEAIKRMIAEYLEREKTREFYKLLIQRSEEAKKNPEILIPLKAIK